MPLIACNTSYWAVIQYRRMAKETVSFRIDSVQREALDRVAKQLDRDRSYLIGQAIKDFLEIQESQIACIKERLKQADAGQFASDEETRAAFQKRAASRRRTA